MIIPLWNSLIIKKGIFEEKSGAIGNVIYFWDAVDFIYIMIIKVNLELVLTMHEVIAHYNQIDTISHDEL